MTSLKLDYPWVHQDATDLSDLHPVAHAGTYPLDVAGPQHTLEKAALEAYMEACPLL